MFVGASSSFNSGVNLNPNVKSNKDLVSISPGKLATFEVYP